MTDPRVPEVAAELAYPGIVQDRHEDHARVLLTRADAADAAAGIRRVTLDDLVAERASHRNYCRATLIRSVRESGRSPAERDLLAGWLDRMFEFVAAQDRREP